MRICGVGDNVVDRYPRRGLMYPGGNALNVAVHATRRGADGAYLGVTGNDAAGAHIRAALAAEGVRTERARTAEGPTAYATVHLDDGGNRHFGDCSEGVSRFRLTPDDLDWLAGFDLVHTGDCAHLEDQLPRLARAARRTSYDFSDRSWHYAGPLLPYLYCAVFSRPDADDTEAAHLIARAHTLGPRLVVVTRGGRGALIGRAGRAPYAQSVVPVEPLDTLGAGDSFIAALLVALLDGRPLEEAAARAAAYAAEVCALPGAFGHPAAFPVPGSPSATVDRTAV
ncbi:PfkB family carbohydrate kinase [Streptomyces javensis]|uniref:PfkB family carbohydrate kinase n=1 Tax=Streptomyces javensis TaxID=114698 RepID=UPI00340AB228